MELPIDNKDKAKSEILTIIFLILGLFVLLIIWDVKFTKNLIFILTGFSILISIFFIYMFRKNNIRKAYLKDDKFVLLFRKKLIEVPLSEVISITSATNNYITFERLKAKMSTSYIIDLKHKYPFGDTLFFKFEFNNNLNSEPEMIRLIKEKVGS